MKKLILVLLTGLFLSNTSYGATIKELLDGQKSIKLSCLINSYNNYDIDDLSTHKRFEGYGIGQNFFISVEKDLFKKTHPVSTTTLIEYKLNKTTRSIYEGTELEQVVTYDIEREIVISDDFIKLKSIEYAIGENRTKERDYEKVDIRINRYTGELLWKERVWTWGVDITIKGKCIKMDKKQF